MAFMEFISSSATWPLLISLISIYGIYYLFFRISPKLPPGPLGLPIVGNLEFFSKKAHLKLTELSKKYGPIYSARLGSNDLVVICGYNCVRNALLQDAFVGVPPTSIFGNPEHEEIAITDGVDPVQLWTEQKRFVIHLLKDVGFGRTKMEEHIKEEIGCVLDIIKKGAGESMQLTPFLNPSVSNNIASLIFGRRMAYNDPKRIMLDNILKDFNKLFGQMAIAAFFPWIHKGMQILGIGNVNKLEENTAKLTDFFNEEIQEHEKTLDPENIRDFIDGYLVQIEKTKHEKKPRFVKEGLQQIAQTFFSAGADTVRFTIEWIFLVVAAFGDVQERIQKEIDDVIGFERFPTYKDHAQMPFTQAVIMETMRWRNVFPLNFFRYTLKDTEINSVFVPKNTCILLNTWSVSHDSVLWGHPETFRPERFLTLDGKKVKKPEHFLPFSAGKRICPGESFANIEVFLYLTAILQKFKIIPPHGTEIDLEGNLALSLQPKTQDLVFTHRH